MGRFRLWAEWAVIFIVAPVLIMAQLREIPWLLILGGVTASAAVWLSRRGGFHLFQFWRGEDIEVERRQLKGILVRFCLSAVGLIAVTSALFPERLFDLPRTAPLRWALLLASYPLISVYPQELLYRAFFARRYRELFPRVGDFLPASALVFAWVHIIFRNPLAVLLTLIGGWFFAQTYAQTRSLRLVCLEHSLYGGLIFSVGLGEFFLQFTWHG
jgi:uncharacterized protein